MRPQESAAVIHADRVWADFGLTGRGVNVAVIDSGVDAAHPDLGDHIVAQHCFTQGGCAPNNTNEGGSAQDVHGHGTHIAGIITGKGSVSPKGIAPDTGIVAVRVLDNNGAGWTSDVVAAIDWVVANQWQHNVRISTSLGGGQYTAIAVRQTPTRCCNRGRCGSARAGVVVFAAPGTVATRMLKVSGVQSPCDRSG
jgi:subtilisin family serine protease